MDVCGSECLDAEEQSTKEEMLESDAAAETPAEELQPALDGPCGALPEHIKVEIFDGSTGFIFSMLFIFITQARVEITKHGLFLFRFLFFK